MTVKIEVRGLFKIFGEQPERALDMLRDGIDKARILKTTGMTVGVDDASFEVRAGEIFVVMGLSGSGKSTLLRLLNRLIEPTAGTVRIDGGDITRMDRRDLVDLRRRDMSMVFQSFALMPHLKVWRNVAFGLDVAGVKQREQRERAAQALTAVGLEAWADAMPSELSGGMRQRVGLARALCNDPSILLMDEAFSALDPLIRADMQNELLRLQADRARTIVFISHDLDEAVRIADRIAIMSDGRIIQVGTPIEILKAPADAYVRAFLRGVDVAKILTAGDIARRDQMLLIRHGGQGPRGTLRRLRDRDREFAFVEDDHRRFRGIVSADSLASAILYGADRGDLDGALLPGVAPVAADTPMEDVLGKVAASPCPLPVIDATGVYVGAISKTTLLEILDRARMKHDVPDA